MEDGMEVEMEDGSEISGDSEMISGVERKENKAHSFLLFSLYVYISQQINLFVPSQLYWNISREFNLLYFFIKN